jgi:diguanylate cyclase (GGDEF)-like protein
MGAFRRLYDRGLALPPRVQEASGLMQVSWVVVLVGAVWFAVNMVRPVGPHLLLWVATPVNAVVLTATFRRTGRTEALPLPTRRFFNHLGLAAALVGVATVGQAVDVVAHPTVGGPHNGPVLLTVDSVAIAVIIYALYRLPVGTLTRGERLRVALDGATVLTGTSVFIWHFQTRLALGSGSTTAVLASLVISVLAFVVVLAVTKVALSRYRFIDKSALRWLAIAIFLGATGTLLQPLIGTSRPFMVTTQFVVPVVFCCAAWAAERQRAAASAPRGGFIDEGHAAFSFVPYGAVAAVDALLESVIWSGDRSDERVIVASAVFLTALVVTRQITAFQDNSRLVTRLDHGATHDALTQLPNRALFGTRLQQALAAPGNRPISVALIDLDDFKEVNDTLGHEVGDLLLVAVAQRLAACVRVGDTVARLGGDEFVVVLDGAESTTTDLAAGRMIAALGQPVLVDGHELEIQASIGIADGRTGDDASVLLRHADIAMYAAKKLAGTTYLHYHGGMATIVTDHAPLGAELRDALADGQLFLLYQPIVALADCGLVGVEALVRWTHPVHGTMSPDTFIPVAERTGLIVPLGRWVFREASRQFAVWCAEHADAAPVVLNVNVSARELRESDFAAYVASTLAEFGIDAHHVVLEITETTALDLGPSVATLHHLHSLGIRISLDDFGTANSTLSLLHDCPVDEIKLDKSFTQARPDGRIPMAAAVLHLAHALGLHAVAEGVETAEQAEQLRAMGYPTAQGYFFGRPTSAKQIDEWLSGGLPLGGPRTRGSVAPTGNVAATGPPAEMLA